MNLFKNKRIKGIFLLILGVSLVALVGCGQATQEQTQLSGEVNIDGSSTVFPITEAVAEEFLSEHPDVKVPVGVSGTGGGFKKFNRPL